MISDSTFYITLKVIKLSSLNLKAWLSAIAKWDNWDIIAISWDQRSGDQLLSNIKHSNTLLHMTAITSPVHAAQPSSKESTSYGSPAAQRYEQPNQDMSIKASSSTAEDQCMLLFISATKESGYWSYSDKNIIYGFKCKVSWKWCLSSPCNESNIFQL